MGLLVLFLCVAATYWKVLKYPFIQDDWGILFSIVEMDDFEIIQQAFLPEGKLFYRPLGITYFVLAHWFFGLNSLGYHILALGLHFVNSLLVVRMSGLFLKGNKLLPWLAGILYGTAVAVHMDPLLWVVGIYDLACAFFFFSSFILFTKQRHIQSALVLALAMLFKESAVVLIPILFLYDLLLTGGTSRKALLTKLTPFMLVLLAFLYLRIQMISPWSLPATHPYRTLFWGQHLLSNLLSYSKWAAEAVLPLRDVSTAKLAWIVGFSAVAWLLLRRKRELPGSLPPPSLILLAAWMALGLAPVFFFKDHSYRYYLLYSLVPLVILILAALAALLRQLSLKSPQVTALMAVFVAMNVISSGSSFHQRDQEGLSGEFIAGTNHLIQRGRTVELVQATLLRDYPTLPRGAILIFDGLDISAFGRDAGPRVWYRDRTLTVFDSTFVGVDSSGTLFTFRFEDGLIQAVPSEPF